MVEVAERFADGAASYAELVDACNASFRAEREVIRADGTAALVAQFEPIERNWSSMEVSFFWCASIVGSEDDSWLSGWFAAGTNGCLARDIWEMGFASASAAVRAAAWEAYRDADEIGREDAWRTATTVERAAQADLYMCMCGPIPRAEPAWLSPDVRALARAAYDSRDWTLPLLSDALEDAGCEDVKLLAHLRGPGPHGRGCWALDPFAWPDGAPEPQN
jgi:hypothetical protein